MSPTERLNAAAEKIEGAMRPERDCGLPWIRDDLSIVTSADRDLVVSEDFYGPDADLIVLAVNAMPGLAFWLREMASEVDNLGTGDGHEAHGQDPWTDLCNAALAVADQILGGQR